MNAPAPHGQPDSPPKPERLVSLDAYRGFVMLAMVSGGLGIGHVAEHYPDNRLLQFLDYQLSHVAWVGCSFWDLIQPSFMFMVGVAMPYSYASRVARGDSSARIAIHVLWRALVLVLLGVFLRSNGSEFTRWTFEDVLSQIGLGYAFVYLLLGRGLRVQCVAVAGILLGYWLAFSLYPVPPTDFDLASVNAAEPGVTFSGFFAHWNKNTNLAWAFDFWFLNLFPWPDGWRFNGGGYATLSFIPSMGTAILGLMAGELLRGSPTQTSKAKALVFSAVVCLALGWLAGLTLCPIVKRIWTPSWVLFSGGWTLAMLAAFHWIIDVRGLKRGAFPLVVVGMNSIGIYVMNALAGGWIPQTLRTHFGQDLFEGVWGPMWSRSAVLTALWLVCWWMYRRKIFLRI